MNPDDYDDDGNNIVPCPICLDRFCPSKEDGECPKEEQFVRDMKLKTLKDRIINFLSEGQVTDSDRYPRSKEYKGFWLNDNDAPLYTYDSMMNAMFKELGYSLDTLKKEMKDLRNDGLVELIPAVNFDYQPSGSGWSLTEKGMQYAVDNDLVIL